MLDTRKGMWFSNHAGIALVITLLATSSVHAEGPAAKEWIRPIDGDALLSVRLETDDDEPLIPGLQAGSARVIVRNNSDDRVVAIRGANWWEGGIASLNWYGPMQGSAAAVRGPKDPSEAPGVLMDLEGVIEREEKQKLAEVQSVSYNRTVAAMTDLAFERGVLLPGERLAIALPFTPQQYPNNSVHIAYVVAGGADAPWREEVLVPGEAPRPDGEVFIPANDMVIESRNGRGSMGLLRATMPLGGEGLVVQSADFEVPVPVAESYDLGLTGGLTRAEAAGHAGATIEEMNHLGYYLPDMKTWFFIGADEVTRTLRHADGEWVFDFAVRMPAFAPEFFGRHGEATRLLMNPEVFGHLVEVNAPSENRYYDPGLTELDAEQLWRVLGYAGGKKGMELRVVRINPNGIASRWVLTLGVRVDAAGRWEYPELETSEPDPASTE